MPDTSLTARGDVPSASSDDALALLDSEQLQSDADQALSDLDQRRADEDQTAADREQEARDRDLAVGRVDAATHARSHELREETSRQRRRTTDRRRRASEQRAAASQARGAARAAVEATRESGTGAVPRPGSAAPSGDALLEAVSDAMVALHLRYYFRVPVTAKSQLLGGDLLTCTLEGIYTDVEKTMIELQHHDVVKSTRQAFQAAMQPKFVEAVERLTGRSVATFVSTHHVGPDMAVELFMLEPEA